MYVSGLIPTYVGGYRIGTGPYFQIMMTKKPLWLHRKMMAWFFGWKWFDTKE